MWMGGEVQVCVDGGGSKGVIGLRGGGGGIPIISSNRY